MEQGRVNSWPTVHGQAGWWRWESEDWACLMPFLITFRAFQRVRPPGFFLQPGDKDVWSFHVLAVFRGAHVTVGMNERGHLVQRLMLFFPVPYRSDSQRSPPPP